MSIQLRRGSVLWVDLSPTRRRDQAGTRPAVVVASDDYLASVPDLVIVLPATTTDRGWPHHVRIDGPDVGLARPSFAMTEQPRAVARSRIFQAAGVASASTMAEITRWLRDFTEP